VGVLEDRAAIEELLVHYCYLLDYGMPERVATEVFTEDGVFDAGPAPRQGRAELHDWFVNGGRALAGRAHHLSNMSITVEGDAAAARTYVTTWMWLPAEDGDPRRGVDCIVDGAYHDRLRRTPDGWRIAERRSWPHGPSGLAFGRPPEALAPMLDRNVTKKSDGPPETAP
jgi:hypothetical protein